MYSDQIARDVPKFTADFSSLLLKRVPPIIAGNDHSMVFGNGDVAEFEGMSFIVERSSSFTLEAWILPYQDEEVSILAGPNGGLFWSQGIVFSILLTTGVYTISYIPEEDMAVHVVGVYDGIGMSLYVNGNIVDRISVEPGDFIFDNPKMLSGVGQGRVVLDGLAIYHRSLQSSLIASHYNLGRDIKAITDNLAALGASIYSFEDQQYMIEATKSWGIADRWEDGRFTDVTIQSNSLSGAAGSEWHGIIPVPFSDTIKRSRINWSGSGDFIVQTSIDNGSTWSVVDKRENVPGLLNGTDQYNIDVKIIFLGDAVVNNLEITLYTENTYTNNLSKRPAEFNGAVVTAYFTHDQLEYRRYRGAKLDGGQITILSDARPDADNKIQSIDMWIKLEDTSNSYLISLESGEYLKIVSETFQSNGMTLYINGIEGLSYTFESGEWIHLVIIFEAPVQGPLILGSNFNASGSNNFNGQIGSVSTYQFPLSVLDVARVYRSYFGGRRVGIQDASTISVVEGEGAWDLYNYDWSSV